MSRPTIQLVTTAAGTHARILATNGEPIAWTETHPDERDALNAVRVLAETFAVGPVQVAAGMVVVRDTDGEPLGLQIERVDERDSGAAGEQGEGDPAAPVEGDG